MYTAVYLEINMICMMILCYIYLQMKKNEDQQTVNISFYHVLERLFIILLIDGLSVLVDGKPGFALRNIGYIINIAYLTYAPFVSYTWFSYTESSIRQETKSSLQKQFILQLPIIVLFVLCIMSPWKKWIFYLDDMNHYVRGDLHIFHIVITYFYLLLSAIWIARALKKTQDPGTKQNIAMLMSFIVLPSLGGVFSAFVPGMPSIWPLATVSLLMVYSTIQNGQISSDALTGLNNRRQFDKKLHTYLHDSEADVWVSLCLFDIDHFKRINDTFGHYEGDCALKEMADILRKACSNKPLFLARYGGDEFAVLLRSNNPHEMKRLLFDLETILEERNRNTGKPYKLAISSGTGSFMLDGSLSAETLINAADTNLYQNKRIAHEKNPV